jgi:phage I-like protein
MITPIQAPGVAILFADGEAPLVGHTTWNQVTKAGEYRGHRQGTFVFDDATHAEILANFAADGNGRVPVDFEHLSELVPDSAAHDGVPAIAWVTALELRDGNLWASFEWTDPKAVEMVRARQYLYVSPAVNFCAVDKITGEDVGARLTSVALTNHPFLDGMEPLTASDRAPSPTVASLTPESVHIPAAVAVVPPEKKAIPTMDENELKELRAAAERYKALAARVCKLADVDPEAGEDAALDKLAQTIAEMKKAQQAEAAEMSGRVIAAGKAPETARARLTALCLADRETFDALYPVDALGAKPTETPDAKLMRTPVSPTGGKPVSRTPAPRKSHSEECDDRAQKLMSEHAGLGYEDALILASRTLRDEAVAQIHAAVVGG